MDRRVMSDYLWDRTGEGDAEVERLEGLLGTFAHRPRPLELPAGAAPDVRHAGARRFYAPAWLAAAAALLLACLVVAAVYLRARVATGEKGNATQSARRAETSEPTQTTQGDERKQSAGVDVPEQATPVKPSVTPRAPEPVVTPGRSKAETVAVAEGPRAPRRQKGLQLASSKGPKAAGMAPAAARASGGFTFEAPNVAGMANSLVESTGLLAKEQLVYAMRLTGAKLRDVQQRAQGADDAKSSPR